MSSCVTQACPFCAQPARFHFADYENRKHFFCETCTEFEISRYAENVASTASAEWKSSNSTAAQKAPKGSYYRLMRPATPQPGVELEGIYVKREQ